LLDWRTRLRSNVQFCESRTDLENVDAGSVEDLLRRRDGDSKIGVFCEARDEEHKSAGLDLHLSEIGTSGGDVSMLGHALLVRLEDAGYALETIVKWIVFAVSSCDVRNSKASCALVQD
jgi:hypothetical protein